MRKSNQLAILLATSMVILSASLSILADIASPRASIVSIQTKQEYPDFDFYFGVVPVSSYYDRGRHYTPHFEKLELKSIQFSPNKPFQTSNTNTDDNLIFLAISKNSGSKDEGEIKNKVITAIKNKSGDGIYFFYLNPSVESSGESDSNLDVNYLVETIDSSGIKTNRTIDKSTSLTSTDFINIGAGLVVTGIIIGIGLLVIKILRKK